MFLGRNRKGSGIVLTGAFAVSGAISLAQQGVASANQENLVDETVTQSLLWKIWENKWGKVGILTVGALFLVTFLAFVVNAKIKSKTTGVKKEIYENNENKGEKNNEKPANKVTLSDVYNLMAPEDQALYKFMRSYSRIGANLLGDILYLNEENDSICYKWIPPHYLDNSAYYYLVAMQKNVQEGRKIVPLKNWVGTKEDSYLYGEYIKGKICAYIDGNEVHILDKKYRKEIENKIKSKEENFKGLKVAEGVAV